jgi:hypothetical protein
MKKTLAFTLGALLLIGLATTPALAKKRHKKHHHKKHAQSQIVDDEKRS